MGRILSATLVLTVGLAAAAPGPAYAASRIGISIESAEFEGLRIERLELGLLPASGGGASAKLSAGRITGVEATGPLAGLAIDCHDLRIRGDALRCERGQLSGALGTFGQQDTRFIAEHQPDGSLALTLESFALAGGSSQLQARFTGPDWQVEVDLAGASLATLAALARPWAELPEGFSVAGQATGRVTALGRDDNLSNATLALQFTGLEFADAEGLLAGEAVTGRLDLDVAMQGSGAARLQGRVSLASGQAYSDPVFLDFGKQALDLDFSGLLSGDATRFTASEFTLHHHGVARLGGSATLDLAGETLLASARTRIEQLELATALPAYLQPYLVSTAFRDIEGAGRIRGEADIDAGQPSRLVLELEEVALDSQTGSLFIAGLGGNFSWFDEALRNELAPQVDSEVFKSHLAWREARLWGIEIGAVELPFTTTGRHFRMLDPVLLPVFDGGLAVETLRIRHAGTEQMYLRFDAEVLPISVAHIGRAMGWPEFSGTLSGRIPKLELADGFVTLGGNVEARVFDGGVVVRDLRLRNPLGKFPRLYASIDVDNLDLEQVTNTFSFGMMTGRLSGRVEGLETFNWMPEAFTARFYTTPGDKSPHRISQRAVANLSSIGGGSGGSVTAALQAGFLRFFETFRYDRIGLSCVLANDVCEMDGAGKADGGYYIVKGAGLPRIDVIGSQKRVAWRRLVSQLGEIIEGQAPVIR